MTAIRAVDMPRVRDEVANWVGTYGRHSYEKAISVGKQHVRPLNMSVARSAEVMATESAKRLERSELFHVTEHMTDLITTASTTMPEFTLRPADLPSEYGLVYYSKPIRSYTYNNDLVDWDTGEVPVPIVAMSWGPWCGSPWPGGGVWIDVFSDARALLEAHERIGMYTAERAAQIRAVTPPLYQDNELQLPFSDSAIQARDRATTNSNVECAFLLRATWLLMQQSIASVENAHFDRATRRRYAREQKEPPPVRVIGLRNRSHASGGSDSDREYHHQWIVRGHWRQHWYPSLNDHRPVWIAPHIKGPEGAPLLGGERVYALKR